MGKIVYIPGRIIKKPSIRTTIARGIQGGTIVIDQEKWKKYTDMMSKGELKVRKHETT